ncbi:MAG: shikimate dehydrogenase [Cellulomonadaceae bacterium]|nr:shikimate dehydrogenase [Cellulomonadaceae bacterium]
MSAAPLRAAVLGHPVAHSLSPTLHRAAYAALGLEGWRYDAVDVEPAGLQEVLGGVDDSWAGLSVTMPLKRAVMTLVDQVEPLAAVVGAANTVLVQPGRAPMLVAANTDVFGVVRALREGLTARSGGADEAPVRDAVILGAGATAASTLAALAELGCMRATVIVRSMARAGATMRAAHRMGVEPRFVALEPMPGLVVRLESADVVVSTLPPGAADPIADALGERRVGGVLLDCAYEPQPTRLGSAWAVAGGTVVGGERMLLHQATEQVRLMTGLPAPIAAMDAALRDALTRR